MCQPVTKTPSAPFSKAFSIYEGTSIPEHIRRISLMLGGYCILPTPARSAPAYEHQLQAKAMIFGTNSSDMLTPISSGFLQNTEDCLHQSDFYYNKKIRIKFPEALCNRLIYHVRDLIVLEMSYCGRSGRTRHTAGATTLA